jgi:hypothetical protein
LKADPEFPGEHCTQKDLRRFRRSLFNRPDSQVGAEFKGLRDLYLSSGFRDLILHVSEQRFTLPQIAQFLDAEGLAFRGFLEARDFDKLKQRFPGEVRPGRLQRWSEFEAQNPGYFTGMYSFWCERVSHPLSPSLRGEG